MQINKLITHNKFLITDPSLGVQHISTIWQEEMCSPDTTKGKERTQYPDPSASLVPSSYLPNYDGSAGILSSENKVRNARNKYYQEMKEVLEQRSLASTSLNLLHKVTSQDMSVNP
jgi:hypothetical protein